MPSFRQILTASDVELVKFFYKIKSAQGADFIQKIDHAALRLELNHCQLVCALGFNRNIRDLTDILSLLGFSSYKLLTYRRNELFATDAYRALNVDNVVDIYAEHIEDNDILATLCELLPLRLKNIEVRLAQGDDPAAVVSYKLEMHSIYAGGIATAEFAAGRIESASPDLRVMIDEIQMILDADILPPGNMFFCDGLLPAEKRQMIERNLIDRSMIENRLRNSEISEDERQMLEDYVA